MMMTLTAHSCIITQPRRALELEELKATAEEKSRLREKVTPLLQMST
jgi:hypothetical protein